MEEEAMKEEYRMRAEESEQHIQELLEKVCVCVWCVHACVCAYAHVHTLSMAVGCRRGSRQRNWRGCQ